MSFIYYDLTMTEKMADLKRHYVFMAGLPRSGGTLLASILNQNPAIHSGASSPVCGMMNSLKASIEITEQFRAYPKPHVVPAMCYSVLDSFYSDREEEIVVDKSREWATPRCFATLRSSLPYEPRVILPVRPIIEILASFISLIHNNSGSVSFLDRDIQVQQVFNFYRHPDDTRCDHLMLPKGPIDNALYGLAFACQPENSRYFHFVEYDDLVSNTEATIDGIYDFLGLEKFSHSYDDIQNMFHENDEVHGLNGMHDVRRTISKKSVDPQKVLSPYVLQKYSNMEFWRDSAKTS